jgi:hypothetical protein
VYLPDLILQRTLLTTRVPLLHLFYHLRSRSGGLLCGARPPGALLPGQVHLPGIRPGSNMSQFKYLTPAAAQTPGCAALCVFWHCRSQRLCAYACQPGASPCHCGRPLAAVLKRISSIFICPSCCGRLALPAARWYTPGSSAESVPSRLPNQQALTPRNGSPR